MPPKIGSVTTIPRNIKVGAVLVNLAPIYEPMTVAKITLNKIAQSMKPF